MPGGLRLLSEKKHDNLPTSYQALKIAQGKKEKKKEGGKKKKEDEEEEEKEKKLPLSPELTPSAALGKGDSGAPRNALSLGSASSRKLKN